MPFRRKLFLIAIIAGYGVFSSIGKASANGLSLSGATLQNSDATANTVKIKFSASWDNSWSNQTNHDAVWVFAKYSTDSGTTWNHATLKAAGLNPSGFETGSGTAVELYVPDDKKGVFVRRATQGSGPVSVSDLKIVWDYGTDGLSDADTVRIKVVGIEMVYIPLGPFYLGDGDGSTESLLAFHTPDNVAFYVSTSPVTGVSCDSNAIDDIDTQPVTLDGDGGITGNSRWPVGYNAFYAMKYEITEGQWVEFFNTLTAAQKLNRDLTNPTGKNSDSTINRNTIFWDGANASTTRPNRACGYLSWMDGCAYSDWAGIRPLTETEYEKSARGSQSPSNGEMAWGTTDLDEADALSGAEDGTEFVSTIDGNVNAESQTFSGGDGGSGPLRVGIFATSTSSRVKAGASYYGVMELSGNLAEGCVGLGTSTGRAFNGTHGDGLLSSAASYEGNATNSDWPGIDNISARGVTSSTGSGVRGGGWNSSAVALRVSDRSNAGVGASSRQAGNGFRGGRSVS